MACMISRPVLPGSCSAGWPRRARRRRPARVGARRPVPRSRRLGWSSVVMCIVHSCRCNNCMLQSSCTRNHAARPRLQAAGLHQLQAAPAAAPRGAALRRRVGKAGLKTTQYSLLSHVLKLGPIRPGDLAAAMKMDAVHADAQPAAAARRRLAARWPPGADGRSRLVQHHRRRPRQARRGAAPLEARRRTALNQLLGVAARARRCMR